MSLRKLLRRLERTYYQGEVMSIPQPGGTVARFPKEDLASASVVALDRELGRSSRDHPLCQATRRSPDPKWSKSVFAGPASVPDPPEDLSEQEGVG